MITVAGEALIDLIAGRDGQVEASPGGGPFNTARAIARLGQPAAFLGRLSSDRFGRELAAKLDADGVRLLVEAGADEPTTLAVLDIDQAGVARYRFYLSGTAAAALSHAALSHSALSDSALSDVALSHAALSDSALPAGTTALHIGSLALVMEPIATTIEQLVLALPADVLLMLDPNCRPSAVKDKGAYLARIARLMPRVDIVKTSAEDLAYLSADAPGLLSAAHGPAAHGPAAHGPAVHGPAVHGPAVHGPAVHGPAVHGSAAYGPAAVVVTDGAAAVHAYIVGGQVIGAKVPPVDVVDTVGAGDAFGGGFLAWWIRNGLTRADVSRPEPIAAATAAAIEAAAVTCTRRGAEPPWLSELRGRPGWER
jgi:fructokinase